MVIGLKKYLEFPDFETVVAHALENLFDVLHKAIVENGFLELDIAVVTLALPRFSTGLTNLVGRTDTESEIVGA